MKTLNAVTRGNSTGDECRDGRRNGHGLTVASVVNNRDEKPQ
jgi:hypothetical protein